MAYPLATGAIQLLEVGTWKETGSLDGHPGGTSHLAFDSSGRYLATTGADGSVKVWETGSRKLVNELGAGVGPNSRITFTSDGQGVVVTGTDGTLRVFGRKKVVQ